jgi:hypothetical protein
MSLQVPQFGSLLISEIGEALPSYCLNLALNYLAAAVKQVSLLVVLIWLASTVDKFF